MSEKNLMDVFEEAMRIAFHEGSKQGETFDKWWSRVQDKAMRGQLLSLSAEAPIFKIQSVVADAEIER